MNLHTVRDEIEFVRVATASFNFVPPCDNTERWWRPTLQTMFDLRDAVSFDLGDRFRDEVPQ
jgi:hypothetical protein